mmetsp:Transcript_4882/g.11577  ORF Transcript_4882/g.11577 Transcript_4882/m.11577 type:complete len:91 (+) Transcript_4882:209-481(+)
MFECLMVAANHGGVCTLGSCAEQFNLSGNYRMDGSGTTGNLVGKPCACSRVCDNFGHCHTNCSCPAMKGSKSGAELRGGTGAAAAVMKRL